MTVRQAIEIDFKKEYGVNSAGNLPAGALGYEYLCKNKRDNFDGRQFNTFEHANKYRKQRKK